MEQGVRTASFLSVVTRIPNLMTECCCTRVNKMPYTFTRPRARTKVQTTLHPCTKGSIRTLHLDSSNTSFKNKLVIVEGNIGAGKTFLASQLADLLGFKVYHEPATKNPYLAKFYEEPNKYALKLQVWLFEQRLMHYLDAMDHLLTTGEGVVLDRSVYSDIVFANVGFQDGFINDDGYRFYLKLRENAMSHVLPPHACIFLDVPAKECQQRIIGRGRPYEQNIELRYLNQLEEEYIRLIRQLKKESRCAILHYDWTDFGRSQRSLRSNVQMPLDSEVNSGAAKIASELQSVSYMWNEEEIAQVKAFLHNEESIKTALSVDSASVTELLNVT